MQKQTQMNFMSEIFKISYDGKYTCMTLKQFRFSTVWVFLPFYFFFLNCAIAKDPVIQKII